MPSYGTKYITLRYNNWAICSFCFQDVLFFHIIACHESCDGDLDQHTALAETQVGACYGEVTSTSNNCKLCDWFNYYPDDNLYCVGQYVFYLANLRMCFSFYLYLPIIHIQYYWVSMPGTFLYYMVCNKLHSTELKHFPFIDLLDMKHIFCL